MKLFWGLCRMSSLEVSLCQVCGTFGPMLAICARGAAKRLHTGITPLRDPKQVPKSLQMGPCVVCSASSSSTSWPQEGSCPLHVPPKRCQKMSKSDPNMAPKAFDTQYSNAVLKRMPFVVDSSRILTTLYD